VRLEFRVLARDSAARGRLAVEDEGSDPVGRLFLHDRYGVRIRVESDPNRLILSLSDTTLGCTPARRASVACVRLKSWNRIRGRLAAEPGTDALTRLDEHHGLVARAARGWWRRA
jgi:hypothetical protein